MTTASKVLAIAAGEVGYSRWTDPARGTKYARETQPALWPRDTWLLANGIAFCDIFVTWAFWKAGALDILPGRQSYNTDYRANAGRAAGALVTASQARPGDVLVFDWNPATAATNHVGILEKVTAAGNPQSIEGNTSPGTGGSQSNGGGVYRRVRRWGQVRYIIRPQWAKVAPSGGVSGGTSKPVSRPVQGGRLAVDGRWGRETSKALQRFLNSRTKAGLSIDGRMGPASWRALQDYLSAPYKDGKISRQSYRHTELGNGISPNGWEYTGRRSSGSQTIELLQKWVKAGADGVVGGGTTSAVQRKLNEHGVGM